MLAIKSQVQRVLWLVLALNLAVTVIKLMVGFWSGALAVVADAFHSLVDSSGNIVGLLGVWAAARPADDNHPYGHHKYETIAAMSIGVLLLVAAYEIGKGVFDRLLTGAAPPDVTPLTFGLMGLTFAVNVGIVAYETRAGRRLRSQVLLADAAHTRTDLFVTLSVIVSLIGAWLGWGWLDAVVAGVVVVLLFRAAFEILQDTSKVLTDVAMADPATVEKLARAVPGVRAVSGVRSRGRSDTVYVDLNVAVDPAMTTTQAHNVATEVERQIAGAVPGVVEALVHVEPRAAQSTPWEALTLQLRAVSDALGLGLHDLHAHTERSGGYSLELHLEMESHLTLGEAHARADEFERRVRAAMPEVRALVTHIEPLSTHLPDEAGPLVGYGELRRRIAHLSDEMAGVGACHEVHLHNVAGHLTATLHVTQPAEQPLPQAHALAEAIEQKLHAAEPSLHRVVVHVEPPE